MQHELYFPDIDAKLNLCNCWYPFYCVSLDCGLPHSLLWITLQRISVTLPGQLSGFAVSSLLGSCDLCGCILCCEVRNVLYVFFFLNCSYKILLFSAFLLVYNILGNIELQNEIQGNGFGKNVVLFGKHVLHRYIRLTPALLATVLQTEFANQFMQKYSSFYISETRDFQCGRYITNFLCISPHKFH